MVRADMAFPENRSWRERTRLNGYGAVARLAGFAGVVTIGGRHHSARRGPRRGRRHDPTVGVLRAVVRRSDVVRRRRPDSGVNTAKLRPHLNQLIGPASMS